MLKRLSLVAGVVLLFTACGGTASDDSSTGPESLSSQEQAYTLSCNANGCTGYYEYAVGYECSSTCSGQCYDWRGIGLLYNTPKCETATVGSDYLGCNGSCWAGWHYDAAGSSCDPRCGSNCNPYNLIHCVPN